MIEYSAEILSIISTIMVLVVITIFDFINHILPWWNETPYLPFVLLAGWFFLFKTFVTDD